ncbi:hypothetical protein [Nocardioides sp.]|uniref:hypothetical protein n=1 Tax=Nocardioides sp. TaxID=35761 RepID=UPI002D071586|nr:hypothetical protein [Nocardioides sp.]HSX69083.1 hypothetical protein [Nocardioides sp.]
MSRHAAFAVLVLAAPLLTGCSGPDPELVDALTDRGATTLFVPEPSGSEPRSWRLGLTGSVQIDYRGDFGGVLTIDAPTSGDLCATYFDQYDGCERFGKDAAHLWFEEMDAIAVRRDGRELMLSGFSTELPDEDYPTEEALTEAIHALVKDLVDAARTADVLTPEEFVEELPNGKVADR